VCLPAHGLEPAKTANSAIDATHPARVVSSVISSCQRRPGRPASAVGCCHHSDNAGRSGRPRVGPAQSPCHRRSLSRRAPYPNRGFAGQTAGARAKLGGGLSCTASPAGVAQLAEQPPCKQACEPALSWAGSQTIFCRPARVGHPQERVGRLYPRVLTAGRDPDLPCSVGQPARRPGRGVTDGLAVPAAG